MGSDGSQHWFIKLIRGTFISDFLKILLLFLSQLKKKKEFLRIGQVTSSSSEP